MMAAMMVAMIFLALVGALFFGLALILTQPGLKYLGPLPGSCVAIATACGLFILVSPFTIDLTRWHSGSAVIFALIGCLFPATVTLLTFYANQRVGPTVTGTLGNLAPVFAVIVAIAVLGEPFEPGKIMGILFIVAGVVLLYRTPRLSGLGWVFLLPVTAACIRGAVQPAVKIGMEDWPNPFAAVTIGYMVSVVMVLICGAVKNRGWPLSFHKTGWLWFAAVGLCNGLAVLCLYQALALGPVTIVAPLVACYPLVPLAYGWLSPGTALPSPHSVAGVGLTVAGIVLLLSL